jgi:hypothetical protein
MNHLFTTDCSRPTQYKSADSNRLSSYNGFKLPKVKSDGVDISIDYCESQADGIYTYPPSCTSYYMCSSTDTHVVGCPDGLYFNPDSGVCDTADTLSTARQAECGIITR